MEETRLDRFELEKRFVVGRVGETSLEPPLSVLI